MVTPEKPSFKKMTAEEDKQIVVKMKPQDDEMGKLASVPITSFYGNHLTDQQRVDRFNDLRAF